MMTTKRGKNARRKSLCRAHGRHKSGRKKNEKGQGEPAEIWETSVRPVKNQGSQDRRERGSGATVWKEEKELSG